MDDFILNQDPAVQKKFDTYPVYVQEKLNHLRTLIFDVASSLTHVKELEETLKWGEPSYLVKNGSTIRIDWKPKSHDQYTMYFKCTSKLVETFKVLYGDMFRYENNRAILFDIDEFPPVELEECIRLALSYHLLKNKPLLGVHT